jgi:hypothetical protein
MVNDPSTGCCYIAISAKLRSKGVNPDDYLKMSTINWDSLFNGLEEGDDIALCVHMVEYVIITITARDIAIAVILRMMTTIHRVQERGIIPKFQQSTTMMISLVGNCSDINSDKSTGTPPMTNPLQYAFSARNIQPLLAATMVPMMPSA